MSTLFHIIDDAAVILRAKGVYKQVKMYQRAGELYAGWGSGFIGLRREHTTTLPNVSWEDIDWRYGVMILPNGRLARQEQRD